MEIKKALTNMKGVIYFSFILLILGLYSIRTNFLYASSSIIINEMMYDPLGSDLGYEWIELYNPLSTNLNLKDWKIQIAGTTFTTSIILPTLDIASHGYMTICEQNIQNCTYIVPKIGMQNGGSESDGVQILDNKNNVVDTVIFDSPNTNHLTNENGLVVPDNQTAEPSGSSKSIGRKNFIDTDNSNSDFYVFNTPTKGSENVLSDSLAPTGEFPIIILILLLFILLTYSARLDTYLINLHKHFNGKRKERK